MGAEVGFQAFLNDLRQPPVGTRVAAAAAVGELRRDGLFGDRFLGIEGGQAVDQVFQLAHVARPIVGHQAFRGLALDDLPRQALARRLGEEGLDQFGDVLEPFAQRRQAQRHDVQAVEQILAEAALAGQLGQVLMGRGDDAHIGLARHPAADGGVFPFLQHAQQTGLGLQRHVADFVEEQGTALSLLEPPGRPHGGPREGPLFMAEQLAFDQLTRNRRHVDGDERPPLALAVVVQHTGRQLLAGARLAGDQHGQIGRDQARQGAVDFLHGRRAADQGQLFHPGMFGAQPRLLGRRFQAAAHDGDQLVDVERLGQVFEGTAFRRLDRRQDGVLRAHHDDAQFRADFLDARNQVEAVFIGHDDVGDDDVALARRHPVPQGRGLARRLDIQSGAAECLRDHGADRRVVVGDKNGAAAHFNSPGSVSS